jgi:CelD/BcsL family acetyltransferase involved in cellulose biosynthesis
MGGTNDGSALPACRVEIVQSLSDLQPLADQWRELCDVSGGAIEQFEWVTACLATHSARSLETVLVRDGSGLRAVAPFLRSRIRGVTRRVMPGVETFYEPMAFLAADRAALHTLSRNLIHSGVPTLCGRLPETSACLEALKTESRRRGLLRIRPEAAAPYIPLDDSWVSPEQHLSSRRRSDLRRARRRMEDLGRVDVEIVTPSLRELPALLEDAFRIESLSWKGDDRTALACDPLRGKIIRRYVAAAAEQGTLRLCFLKLNDRAVAMQIAVVQSRRFWLLKIGYDAEYARCSPGMLLTSETIAYAARERLAAYEFLGKVESWTELWTNSAHACVSVAVYPFGLRGGLALAADAGAGLIEKSDKQLRRGVQAARGFAKKGLHAAVRRAARNYIAGDTLDDAVRVQQQFHAQGLSTTIGFWDGENADPRAVADEYLAGLDRLSQSADDAYLSIKSPSLKSSAELLKEIADRAVKLGRRIHFDALSTADADAMKQRVMELRQSHPTLELGYTLPGRWRRSVDDAAWAAEMQLSVRVVKGQWADPDDSSRDSHEGFLEVVDSLAGRARHVSVASHNPRLAAEAIRRLQTSGTPCDQELLFGLPRDAARREAQQANIPTRVYVPYGTAYLPYALGRLRKNPRFLWWLTRDCAAAAFRSVRGHR